jgi:hypothetical protein
MRNALKAELSEMQKQELAEGVMKAKLILNKIPDQEIVRVVRESRSQK